ncbi:unnamed protein product [Blepharisma stoltei]|uniref:Uncharacterized protein n=1 Tax=Blepharisma stoltei TaxID=1481888 RepID=A0AAU9K0W2_9CILI|nr:unnamed protein product [Blepharisma stoltei]
MKHLDLNSQEFHSPKQTPNRSFQSLRLRNLNEERLRIKSLDKKDQLLSKIQSSSDIFELENSWTDLKESMANTSRNDDSSHKLKLPLSKSRRRELGPTNTQFLCNIALATQKALSTIKFLENKKKETETQSNNVSLDKIEKEGYEHKINCNNSYKWYKNGLENTSYDEKSIKENAKNKQMPINKSPNQKLVLNPQKPPKSRNKLTLANKSTRVIDTKIKDKLNTSQDLKNPPLSPYDTKIDILKAQHLKIEDLKFKNESPSFKQRSKKPKKLSKAQEFKLIDRLQNTTSVTRILERLNN